MYSLYIIFPRSIQMSIFPPVLNSKMFCTHMILWNKEKNIQRALIMLKRQCYSLKQKMLIPTEILLNQNIQSCFVIRLVMLLILCGLQTDIVVSSTVKSWCFVFCAQMLNILLSEEQEDAKKFCILLLLTKGISWQLANRDKELCLVNILCVGGIHFK